MKKRKLLALCLVPALLAGCAAPAGGDRPIPAVRGGRPRAPEADPAADAAIGTLGAELLRAAREPGENTLLSPLSVALALSMAANGAAEDTLAEFEALLGADVEALNANAASLLADYAALGGSTECSIADSLWLDGRLEANELFLSRCTAFYGARLYQADLDTDGARRAVNNWVGEVTRGLIPEVLAERPPQTVLLLVNALYLKNAWASEFDPLDTRPGDFTTADGSETETDFLSNGLRAEQYFAAEGAAGVVLPFMTTGGWASWPCSPTGSWTPGWRRWTGIPCPPCWRPQRRNGCFSGCPSSRRSGAENCPTPWPPWGWRPPSIPTGPTFPPWAPRRTAAVRQFRHPQGPHRGQREGHRGRGGYRGGGRRRGRAHRLPGAGARPALLLRCGGFGAGRTAVSGYLLSGPSGRG